MSNLIWPVSYAFAISSLSQINMCGCGNGVRFKNNIEKSRAKSGSAIWAPSFPLATWPVMYQTLKCSRGAPTKTVFRILLRKAVSSSNLCDLRFRIVLHELFWELGSWWFQRSNSSLHYSELNSFITMQLCRLLIHNRGPSWAPSSIPFLLGYCLYMGKYQVLLIICKTTSS